MLCLPGLTPVMNVDQATGEIGGKVVRSFLKVPCSRSFARFGSLPSLMNRSASSGSMPSKPTITERLICCLPNFLRRRNNRSKCRNGQVKNAYREYRNATKSVQNDESTAKPAPG